LGGAAALARGRTLASEGRHGEARLELEKAVDLQTRASAPFDEAIARAVLADSLLALVDTRAGVEQLRIASEIFEHLGATRELARVRAAIERATADRVPQSSILSERELEVLRLAAEGRSNASIGERLSISPHTVHRHIANIRTKLGGESKAAIVARAIRDGLL
jgi:DNA-binding CsgD family transcriptional regulator